MATIPRDNEEPLSRAAAHIDLITPLFSAERGVESVNNADVESQYLKINEMPFITTFDIGLIQCKCWILGLVLLKQRERTRLHVFVGGLSNMFNLSRLYF